MHGGKMISITEVFLSILNLGKYEIVLRHKKFRERVTEWTCKQHCFTVELSQYNMTKSHKTRLRLSM